MCSAGYDYSLLIVSFPRFSNVSMLSVGRLSPLPRWYDLPYCLQLPQTYFFFETTMQVFLWRAWFYWSFLFFCLTDNPLCVLLSQRLQQELQVKPGSHPFDEVCFLSLTYHLDGHIFAYYRLPWQTSACFSLL